MKNPTTKDCPKDCIYLKSSHRPHYFTCDYILSTGKRRPCPVGKGCTVYTNVEPDEKPKNRWLPYIDFSNKGVKK